MALEAVQDSRGPLAKHRFRSPEAVDAAHSPNPKIRGMVRDYEKRKPDTRKGDLSRDETRSWLVAWHWELVKRGEVFGSKYAAQAVHSYMCWSPMSSMPHDLGRRDKWRPRVPGAQQIAKAIHMDVSNVRHRMKDLADMKLIDISDGYQHPRLLSFDEESEYQRQKELARLRGWPRPSGKRTVQVTEDTIKCTQVVEEDPVLRERAG